MNDQQRRQPELAGSGTDPAIWRGMTQRRVSRRQFLSAAGTGAGALGLSAFLAACGVKGATAAKQTAKPGGVGSPAWWARAGRLSTTRSTSRTGLTTSTC